MLPYMARTIDELEKEVPVLAVRAVRNAYDRALSSGFSVVVSSNGTLYEVNPDGTRRRLKELKPEVKVKRGAKFRVK